MITFSKQGTFSRGGLLVSVSILLAGCGGYGEVSPMTYEYAKALYGISNRHAEGKLPSVGQQITKAQMRGEISDREAGWLIAIVDDAAGGRWKEAQREARRIMEDQVR